MARLDKEKQMEQEPKRMKFAKNELEKLGFVILYEDNTKLKFNFKGETITLFVYSGWHTGKSIKDGRGIDNLLKQLKHEK